MKAPSAAIAATRPDPAMCAQTLWVDGTLPAREWAALLKSVGDAIASRNAASVSKRAAAGTKCIAALVVAVIVSFIVALNLGNELGVGVLVAGAILAAVLGKAPPIDGIGTERVGFVTALVEELARVAAGARIALCVQFDSRGAIDAKPLPGGRAAARDVTTREESWLRGELLGLRGLDLGWSVTEWHTLTRARTKNALGRVKTKAKLAIERRFAVRLDADGALFSSKVARGGGASQPDGLLEVRQTPRGWSVRCRHAYRGKFALLHPDDIGKSLLWLRNGTGYRRGDRSDIFGAQASTLIHLMKQCENQLAPRRPKKATA
jgi:hypothetical protein